MADAMKGAPMSPVSGIQADRIGDAHVTAGRTDHGAHTSLPTLRTRLRRWTAAIAILAAVSLAAWLFADVYRPLALKCLEVVYGIYDPFTREERVEFGPRGAAPGERQDGRGIAEQLVEWFPRYAFQVVVSEPLPPQLEAVNFQHESLRSQRVREFLDAVRPTLDDARDVFDIASQVRSLTDHGPSPGTHLENDPLELLRRARAGEPFTCRPFALLFGECAVEKGYTSRLVGLSRTGRVFDHAVSEVYVPAFGKWVIIDPDFNIAYRRRGVWQNAAELHDAWQELKARHPDKRLGESPHPKFDADVQRELHDRMELQMVVLSDSGQPLRRRNLDSLGTGIGLEFYEHVIYHARNNYLGAEYPKGHPKRTFQYVVQSKRSATPPSVCPEAVVVTSRENLYFPVGRTEIRVASTAGESAIRLRLGTWTPNFSHFETRTNAGPWIKQPSDRVDLTLSPGTQRLEARSVNLAGLSGETATLAISVTTRDNAAGEVRDDDARSPGRNVE